jgi:hypothetical protein
MISNFKFHFIVEFEIWNLKLRLTTKTIELQANRLIILKVTVKKTNAIKTSING